MLAHIARTYTGKEFGYFHLHTVGDAFIFGDTRKYSVKLLLVLGGTQTRKEGVHTQYTFRELKYL